MGANDDEAQTVRVDQNNECLDVAKHLISLEALKDQQFGCDAVFYGNPMWRAMLELFVAEKEGRVVKAQDIFPYDMIGEQTRLRYCKMLLDKRFIDTLPNANDGVLQITKDAISMMGNLLPHK